MHYRGRDCRPRDSALGGTIDPIERVQTLENRRCASRPWWAEPFLPAWRWAVQHEDNSRFQGLVSVHCIPSELACLCPDLKRPRTEPPCTSRAPFITNNTSGPSSLDSVATSVDPHRAKCMVAKTYGRGHSDINGRPNSINKVALHLALINFMQKLQLENYWRFLNTTVTRQGSSQQHVQTLFQTLRLLGSKCDRGTAGCCQPRMASGRS
ncbi:hypothetical protein EDB87DRAFT_1139038 [Lactarius vividus]|nr:hypothetical protein EDB87DRAFT_1139038 [Lactarius vividus]